MLILLLGSLLISFYEHKDKYKYNENQDITTAMFSSFCAETDSLLG